MLAGRATRTGTLMDRCGEAHSDSHTGAKIAFDVGILEPNSNSHSARSGCRQSLLNVNAGTRDAERERESQEVQNFMQSARANICANHLHDQRGHGRGFTATDQVRE
jgi:hypothetical protein